MTFGFGGLVVSMLAPGTQVRGFKPPAKLSDFSGKKILSMPFFGGEVSRWSHVVDLWHVKDPSLA
jgi:hypothetical protein